MIRLIAGKIGLALITLAFVLTFNFFLFRAVGDPKNDLLRVPHMSQVQREHLIHARGLDRSLLDQYGIYVRNTLTGQLDRYRGSYVLRSEQDKHSKIRTWRVEEWS